MADNEMRIASLKEQSDAIKSGRAPIERRQEFHTVIVKNEKGRDFHLFVPVKPQARWLSILDNTEVRDTPQEKMELETLNTVREVIWAKRQARAQAMEQDEKPTGGETASTEPANTQESKVYGDHKHTATPAIGPPALHGMMMAALGLQPVSARIHWDLGLPLHRNRHHLMLNLLLHQYLHAATNISAPAEVWTDT